MERNRVKILLAYLGILLQLFQIATLFPHHYYGGVDAKPNLCISPPDWQFYDVVSFLDDHKTSNQSTGNNNRLNLQQLYQSNELINSTYRRTPLKETLGNVTLVILINSGQSLNNEQQTYNLELTYRSLVQANITDLRFVMINSKESINFHWVKQMRERLSFPVYQEMEINPLWNLLDGGNGDMFIYDRCGLLTYYIPFPLSFIHTKEPILREALVATYYDSPCKAACRAFNSTLNSTMVYNGQSQQATSVLDLNHYNQQPTNNGSVEVNVTNNASVVVESSPTVVPKLDTNVENQTITRYDRMGEIFMNFFGLSITSISTSVDDEHNENGNLTSTSTSIPALNLTSTSNVIQSSPMEINATTESATVGSNVVANVSEIPPATISTLQNKLRMSMLKIGSKSKQSPSNDVCNRATCAEWSTERLLKARLCCLKSPSSDDEDEDITNSSSSGSLPSTNDLANLSDNSDTNSSSSTSSSSGGFGCELYARWKCNRILPIIRCCLRKVMNDYFDFTIRRREQQQKEQLRNGESSYIGPSAATNGNHNNNNNNKDSISSVINQSNAISAIYRPYRSSLSSSSNYNHNYNHFDSLEHYRRNHQKRSKFSKSNRRRISSLLE